MAANDSQEAGQKHGVTFTLDPTGGPEMEGTSVQGLVDAGEAPDATKAAAGASEDPDESAKWDDAAMDRTDRQDKVQALDDAAMEERTSIMDLAQALVSARLDAVTDRVWGSHGYPEKVTDRLLRSAITIFDQTPRTLAYDRVVALPRSGTRIITLQQSLPHLKR